MTHPCPTRRSSDLIKKALKISAVLLLSMLLLLILALPLLQSRPVQTWLAREVVAPYLSKELQTRVEIGSLYLRFNLVDAFSLRSEEHTSELQSLMRISYAVFCLKKKKTTEQ